MPERWSDEADRLLDEALALPREDRERFLQGAAGFDPALLRAVRAVMDESARSDDFLEPGGALSSALLQDVAAGGDAPPPMLVAGDRVGPYEVIAVLGHGGMGEVYRARDTQLGREVALKVPRAGRQTDLVGRLARESRALAALNHSNIASIYGLAESNGVPALVLELVSGPSLAERLQKGALTVPEAIDIATQIAAALEAAHERGIAHRDLKPANVKVTPDGRVKVLDFGLAKAFLTDAGREEDVDLTAAARRIGIVVGTVSYMSPEQVRSEPADHRNDIWAFGCVLYEMLTGRRAFEGRTTAEVIARVLEREPDASLLPPDTPPSLRRLLRRCLQKQPKLRLSHIRDALLDLDDARAEHEAGKGREGAASGPSRAVWAAAAVGGAAGVALLAALPYLRPAAGVPAAPLRVVLGVPASDTFVRGFQPLTAISPDGRTVVYRGRRDGTVRLFKRRLDALEAEPIPGTENATGPFFSPDGRWLAFDGDGVLKKVLLSGGAATAICPAAGGATGTWTPDDRIVFATNTSRVLRVVPAAGGEPVALTQLDTAAGDVQHSFPSALPDGRTILFTIVRTRVRQVAAVALDTGAVTIITNGAQPRFLPPNHLAFARESAVWAAPFDPARLTLTGEARPVAREIEGSETSAVHFDVAPEGTLVYVPQQASPPLRSLLWVDRAGAAVPTRLESRQYRTVRLSPDGRRAALALAEGDNTDVWVADLERRTMTRLTFEPTVESAPIWSRDGRFVLFRSEREGGGMFRRSLDGTGEVERLTAGGGPIQVPGSFTPDARTLVFTEFRGFRDQAIARVRLDADARTPELILDGRFAQLRPELSPDGRWLAYQSDESGRFEVYVRPYPDVQSGRWQVSDSGGTTPRWRQDGRELFFHDGTGISSVTVGSGSAFAPSPATRRFTGAAGQSRVGVEFDVTADGARVLVIVDDEPAGAAATRRDLVLVQHWLQTGVRPGSE